MVRIPLVGPKSSDEALKMLKDGQAKTEKVEKVALLLDGVFVKYALEVPEARDLLYAMAMSGRCSACVCCRLAPQQKRSLVEMVRQKNVHHITLAIGDGANDVAMIQGAHVGIAVRGKEGNQAVQASDIAISQFRFIVPILMCHGRRAYR